MFPLTNNEAYIKSTGERSTLGAMFGEAGADIATLETKLNNEIAARAELGAHNLLPFDLAAIKAANTSGTWSGNAYTYQGITVTFNTDGTCTATGLEENEYKALGNVFIKYCPAYAYKAGNIISGCPAGGNVNTYSILLTNAAATQLLAYDTGAGGSYNTDVNDSIVAIRFMQNTVVENLTFKPMVTLATDTDPTHQSYAKTNVELTQDVAGLTTKSFTKITDNDYANEIVFAKSGASKIVQVSAPKGISANTNVEIPIPSGYTSEVAIATGTLASFTSDFVISGGKIRMSINNAGNLVLRSSIAITSAIDEILYMAYV